MAPKTELVTIDDAGRDKGKTFVLTEMSAWAAIEWSARAMLSLTNEGVQVPTGALSGGPESIAAHAITLLGLVRPDVALPLMNEAKACIRFQPAGSDTISSQPVEFGGVSAIEEPRTYIKLLGRLFALHVGFSLAARNPSMASPPSETDAA